MPSSPSRTAEAQSQPQVPDASSTTQKRRPKRPAEPDTAQSKRIRLECSEDTLEDTLEDAAWHSEAWRAYAHGSRRQPAPSAGQASTSWGWPTKG